MQVTQIGVLISACYESGSVLFSACCVARILFVNVCYWAGIVCVGAYYVTGMFCEVALLSAYGMAAYVLLRDWYHGSRSRPGHKSGEVEQRCSWRVAGCATVFNSFIP